MKMIPLVTGAGIAALFILAAAHFAAAQDAPAPDAGAGPSGATTPHHPDEFSRLLKEWAPPGSEEHASSLGDARRFLGHYLSTQPLPEVWRFYATKLGMNPAPPPDQPFPANFHLEQFPRVGPKLSDGHAALTLKNTQFEGQAERTASLSRREPNGQAVTVHLASLGDQTMVFVTVGLER